MKIAFIVPVLDEINIDRTFKRISNSCDTNFDVYFAINGKLNNLFTQIRSTFANESKVKAFMVDRPVNEHKLITLGMAMTGDYDATIIYSGKEEPNNDVIKAFISSWKAGNKIVDFCLFGCGVNFFGGGIFASIYDVIVDAAAEQPRILQYHIKR